MTKRKKKDRRGTIMGATGDQRYAGFGPGLRYIPRESLGDTERRRRLKELAERGDYKVKKVRIRQRTIAPWWRQAGFESEPKPVQVSGHERRVPTILRTASPKEQVATRVLRDFGRETRMPGSLKKITLTGHREIFPVGDNAIVREPAQPKPRGTVVLGVEYTPGAQENLESLKRKRKREGSE